MGEQYGFSLNLDSYDYFYSEELRISFELYHQPPNSTVFKPVSTVEVSLTEIYKGELAFFEA